MGTEQALDDRPRGKRHIGKPKIRRSWSSEQVEWGNLWM